jgi:hypothetical protein
MISRQTYNVPVSGNNAGIVDNWKLAVKRALDQAR